MATRGWIGADAPEVRGSRFPWRAYGWSVVAVVTCTVVDRFLVGRIDEANLVLIYLLGVLAVALRGDRVAALVTAISAVGAFDFFFVEPFLTFRVSDTQYLLTFIIMGLVSVVISTLVTQLTARIIEVQRREKRAQALYALSRSLLLAREPMDILTEGVQVLSRELGVPVSGWLLGQHRTLQPTEGAIALSEEDSRALHHVLDGPGKAQASPDVGMGFLPVVTPNRVHGALGVAVQRDGAAALAEVRAVLETGANQIALALDQVMTREDAEAARAQAETERLRSVLLSSVSHDLRTPLTGIVGAAEALATGADVLDVGTRRELAVGIEEEAERLNRLVTNLLQATRLDAGATALHRDWTSVEDIVGPSLARLERVLADRRIDVEIPPDLPLVFVDAVLMEQVLINLLENAGKHTPAGTAILIRAASTGSDLLIEISDRGPGLPPGEEVRIFERFRRCGQGGVAGAGLGLAIVRGIVEAHEGTVTAHQRPGGGATFRFTLPVDARARAVQRL